MELLFAQDKKVQRTKKSSFDEQTNEMTWLRSKVELIQTLVEGRAKSGTGRRLSRVRLRPKIESSRPGTEDWVELPQSEDWVMFVVRWKLNCFIQTTKLKCKIFYSITIYFNLLKLLKSLVKNIFIFTWYIKSWIRLYISLWWNIINTSIFKLLFRSLNILVIINSYVARFCMFVFYGIKLILDF